VGIAQARTSLPSARLGGLKPPQTKKSAHLSIGDLPNAGFAVPLGWRVAGRLHEPICFDSIGGKRCIDETSVNGRAFDDPGTRRAADFALRNLST